MSVAAAGRPLTPRAALVIAALLAVASVALLTSGTDRPLFLAVNGALSALPVPLLAALSLLGLGLYATLLLAPTLLRAPRLLAVALIAAPLAGALSHALKAAFQMPRPLAVLDESTVHVVGLALRGMNSFPSGHATTAGTLMGILLLAVAPTRGRWAWLSVAALVGVAIGVARIAVGAHWPSDVLLGLALGLSSAMVGVLVVNRWPFWQSFKGRAVLAFVLLACAIGGIVDRTDVPAEAFWLRGVLIGATFATLAMWAWQESRRARGLA